MIVHLTEHAWTTNVKILVQVFVVKMLYVMWPNIHQVVHVWKAIRAIHLVLVTNHLHHRVRMVQKCFFFPQRTIVKLNFLHIYSEQNIQPCIPSPCGPNSQCREVDNHAVCSCLPNYIGSAPNCRPECVVSSECAQDKACLNKKCQDPCPGTCGQNARCQVVSHNPICSCSPDFTGDPFVRCVPKISKIYTFS